MARFINPFTDIGFKRIFGQEFSKPLLIHFLNNLLKGEREIVSLQFLDKEQPAVFAEDRSLIYDVYCELENGDKIIVEMQNSSQSFFKNRAVYYTSEAVARQGEKGVDWMYDIKAVYFVAFLNFSLEGGEPKLRTDVALMDIETKVQFSDKMRLIFLQLPYFNKEVDECTDDFDCWIYTLKNMETLNRLPWAAKNSVFERLAQIADVSSMSRQEREQYDVALKRYRDTYAVIDGAEDRGLKKGREEGREEERINSIQIMYSCGITIEMIAQKYNMTVEQVKKYLQ